MPDAPLTVTQIAALIKSAVTVGIPERVRVVGEVSNFSGQSHRFFSLKDGGAAVRCVMFASHAGKVRFPVKDGMEVVATGRVDFYPAQGQVQLYVDRLEPVGEGALELELRRLMAELRELGYFDPASKRALPTMPRRIAVVTSRDAAALQDVINTTQRRWPGCRLLLYDVRVQGDAAAPGISAALRTLSEQGERLEIDAILLTRGGGSIEDLWAFNERSVADAIHDCEIPVVAAIGHETDTTIAELAADLRCATPTQAAMALVPDRAALGHQTDQLADRLRLVTRRAWEHARHRFHAAERHAMFRRPAEMLAPARQRLSHLEQRLRPSLQRRLLDAARDLAALEARIVPALPRRLEAADRRLDALARHLDAVGPQRVLDRGYSYTLGPGGKLLRSKSQTKPGDTLTTVLGDGKIRSVVEGAVKPTPRRRRKPPDDSPSLFGT